MKLAYQVATRDVIPAGGVTAYMADLETSFEKVKAAGYEGVELMVANPRLVDDREILSLMRRYRLKIPMVCTGEILGQEGLHFSHRDERTRREAIQRVKDAIDLASRIGADFINIGRVRGGLSYGGNHTQERSWSVEGLKETARYAKTKNIIVALEPVNSIAATFINSTQDGLNILQEINEPALKLMLDSNHMFLDDVDVFTSIEQAKDALVYVHLADSNRLYPGNCKLDFKTFIEKLSDIGYDGWISVEVFQRPNQDTALQKSIGFLRTIVPAKYQLAYGPHTIEFELPEGGAKVEELMMDEVSNELDPETILSNAIDRPIGSAPLGELVEPGQTVCIISDDVSRPTPVSSVLDLLLPRLHEAGVLKEDVTIMIALGSHRLMTQEEIEDKLGRDHARNYRVLQSIFKGESSFTEVGKSSLGQAILLAKPAIDADIRIGIGNIVPHNTLGFSGGGKILFPGIAAESSVSEFHSHAATYAGGVFGEIENSVRDEIEQWVEKAGLHFIINTILNRKGQVVNCVAGHYKQAHRAGAVFAKEVYGVPCQERADIVIVNGEPSSFDFWQGTKGLNAASIVVKKGGSVILVCPCEEGVGPHPEYLDYLGGKENEDHGDPLAIAVGKMMHALTSQYTTYAYSEGMNTEELKRASMTKITDISALVKQLARGCDGICRIAIIHDGAEILPILSTGHPHEQVSQ